MTSCRLAARTIGAPRSPGAAIVAAVLACLLQAAQAAALVEPPVFCSSGGVLDILMIAKPKSVPTISFPPRSGPSINPTGWVYEVCPRPPSGNQCPAAVAPPAPVADGGGTPPPCSTTTVADYGGVRLALQPGDLLKIRLVNKLPALDPDKVKHGKESGQENLFRNPTNLHTHGLIVPPRVPTQSNPTFGDYVFVQVYNSDNGMPPPPPTPEHQHGEAKMDFIDYKIKIPADHPRGAFWFHPHVHGISLNQVSAGLAGIISIGDVQDYVVGAPRVVRHLILKDMQVLAAGTLKYDYDDSPVKVTDGEVQNQQVSDFCDPRDNGGPNGRHGYCNGAPPEGGRGNNFVGSRWYFTINGQVFPTIHMTSPDGEIWRLTNASAQVSYLLNLVDDATGATMPMQLVAIDGVSITVPAGTPVGTLMTMAGNKFKIVDCPAGIAGAPPVCVRDLLMMPSSRAEVWVTYRNADGAVVAPPVGATATFIQDTPDLGPVAELWPRLKLAKVEFAQQEPTKTAVEVVANVPAALTPKATIGRAAARSQDAAAGCRPLPKDHHRRIFFGMENPSDEHSRFGLGYEEVDQNDKPVPGTQHPVTAFDPAETLVCLPLGPGGSTVHETWELINLATETHNFHIHQTKFTVMDATAPAPHGAPGAAAIKEDNVPVPFAVTSIDEIKNQQHGYCTITQWRDHQCTAQTVVLDIPFSQVGDFVFHCHILEHEDGGMMAKIEVVAGH
jgi:L-ascorbate oxidase